MILFPFKRKVYQTRLSVDEILSRLQERTRATLSNSETEGMNDRGDVLEMTQSESSFVIGKGTGAKKPGVMDTAPVVKGKLEKGSGFTQVKITIGPRSFLLPAIGLLVAIPAAYFGVTKYDFLTFTLAILLLVLMYSDLITKFNRFHKVYMEIVEGVVENHPK
jgi:hypothetical protein